MTYRNRFLAALIVTAFIVLASFGALLYSSQLEINSYQAEIESWKR